MRVFVTGASGHIGSLVVPELLAAGHEVTGLARSDKSAAALAAAGAKAHCGTLDDLDSLRAGAAAADGVIHLAYDHGPMLAGNFADAAALDLAAVQTMGAVLDGSGQPFVVTSGTLLLALAGLGRTGTETDTVGTGEPPRPRVARRTRRSRWPGAGCARRSSGFRRPCTDRPTRTASSRG
jgi:nucleoside-diphosphate-sugar epimerase